MRNCRKPSDAAAVRVFGDFISYVEQQKQTLQWLKVVLQHVYISISTV